MNLQRLKALQATMTTGSVTEAADTMHLSQPAVSRLLIALEAEIGFDLFVREYGRLTPTDEGKLFYKRAQKVLSGIEDLSAIARDIRSYRDGELRLLCTPQAGYSIFPAAIREFVSLYPKVRVNLQIIQRRDIGNISRATEFDIGFTAIPFGFPALQVTSITFLPAVVVMPKGHRYSDRESLNITDLTNENFIMLSPDNLLRSQTDLAMAKQNVRPNLLIECSSPIAVCKMVGLNLGLAIVDPLSPDLVSATDVHVAKLENSEIGLTYGFYYADKKPISKLSEHFMSIVDNILRKIGSTPPRPKAQ